MFTRKRKGQAPSTVARVRLFGVAVRAGFVWAGTRDGGVMVLRVRLLVYMSQGLYDPTGVG